MSPPRSFGIVFRRGNGANGPSNEVFVAREIAKAGVMEKDFSGGGPASYRSGSGKLPQNDVNRWLIVDEPNACFCAKLRSVQGCPRSW